MPKVTFLPHETICPEGAVIDVETGESLCAAALRRGINIEHACELSCACTTCHVHVREGLATLAPADDEEEDLLDKAWGVDPDSRLSCQALMGGADLVVEIPRYTINMVSEHH